MGLPAGVPVNEMRPILIVVDRFRAVTARHARTARQARAAIVVAACLSVAACSTSSYNFGGLFSDDSTPEQPQQAVPTQPVIPQAPVTGNKVALLLPMSATGQTGRIAKAMKQAAELALFDAGNGGITLLTKDTAGTTAGAEAAAQAALAEGAQLILGPLLGGSVKAVAPIAQGRAVPVVAFSSISSVAAPGVFLMSFLPEQEVTNVVRHTVSTGRKNIAALVPNSTYGKVVESALNAAAQRYGANIVTIQRYTRTASAIQAPARNIAQLSASQNRAVQAVLIAEGGNLLRSAGEALTGAGFSSQAVKVLGTGLWDDRAIATKSIAIGGWFAGVSPQQVTQFQQRYQKTYTDKPPRLASLSYDAVSLAIILGRSSDPVKYTSEKITNREGFQGVNGLFRFRPDGRIERGLSILEVQATGIRVEAQAPTRFTVGF